jgi:lipid-A-disaccharide synthase
VSPTVWAWRQKRVLKIGRAADLVLCLFPFEPAFYADHGVAAAYVGHPMADQIDLADDPASQQVDARASLGLDPVVPTFALLPGSRVSEVDLLAAPMIDAALRLRERLPGAQFVAAMANARVAGTFEAAMTAAGLPRITLVQDRPRQVMAAADVVLCAAGTAALETMLVNRPLVMVYRLARPTYLMAKHLKLIRPQLFALPNILAGERLVPELIQDEANGERLAEEALRWLENPQQAAALRERFHDLHRQLRCDASGRAAAAVAGLLEREGDRAPH